MIYDLNRCIKHYKQSQEKIANMILELDNIVRTCDYIANERDQECQPKYTGQQALQKLGVTLANIIIYRRQYQKDIEEGKE